MLVIFGLFLFIASMMGLAHLIRGEAQKRLELSTYKTKMNTGPFTPKEVEDAMLLLEKAWIDIDPRKGNKIKKLFNRLIIEWRTERWIARRLVENKEKEFKVAGELLSSTKIALWCGPKLLNSKRKLAYTAFYPGLIQVILLNIYNEKDPKLTPYKKLIKDLNRQLQTMDKK